MNECTMFKTFIFATKVINISPFSYISPSLISSSFFDTEVGDAVCKIGVAYLCKGLFTQAIFAAIFLLLLHAIEWIDLRMY